MNKNIADKISIIKEKFVSLKSELTTQEERNATLNQELEILKVKNRELAESNLIFSQTIDKLEIELSEVKEINSQDNKTKDKDLEIDFLVKEIDQCISQIKNNL